MTGRIDRRRSAAIYGLVAAGFAILAIDLWLYYREFPYLSYGVSYVNNLIGLMPEGVLRQLADLRYYPPLYYAWIAATHALVGTDFSALVGLNLVFVAISAVYLTALAQRLGMGLFSFMPGLLLVLLPGTSLAVRQLTIEMPLVAMIPAVLYHLHASEGLSRTRHVVLAGVWLGLAMLTKWTAPAYLIGGVVWIVAGALRSADPSDPRRSPVRGALVTLGVAFSVCAWWYLLRMDWSTFLASAANDPNYIGGGFTRLLWDYALDLGRLAGCWQATTGEWADYFAKILEDPTRATQGWVAVIAARNGMLPERIGPGWGLWGVGLAGMGWAVSQDRVRSIVLAGSLVVAPVLILSLPVHGEARYLYPLLPAVALALTYPLSRARRTTVRGVIAAALVAAAAVGLFRFLDAESARPRNLREAAVGVRTETDLIVRYLDARTPRIDGAETGIAVHPIWHNVHSTCDFLLYQIERRGLSDRFDLGCLSPFDYMEFRDRLRRGVYDVIVTDCGPENDCLAADPHWVRAIVAAMAEAGYISQMKGTRSEPFSVEDLAQDAAYLQSHYETVLYLPLDDGTHTRILMRREQPASPAKPGAEMR